MADDILRQGVQGITDLITVPGLVQPRLRRRAHDHARTPARLMGIGTARGEGRATGRRNAACRARSSRRRSTARDGRAAEHHRPADVGLVRGERGAEVVTGHADANAQRDLRRRDRRGRSARTSGSPVSRHRVRRAAAPGGGSRRRRRHHRAQPESGGPRLTRARADDDAEIDVPSFLRG
jgi:hypothetical protein